MILVVIPVTAFAENTYILADDDTKEAIVVDPGGEAERILAAIEEQGVTVKHILCTHGHMDHVGGVNVVREATGATFRIHENDVEMTQRAPAAYTQQLIPDYVQPPAPDGLLKDGDEVQVGALKVRVIETPGHTMGSLCLAVDGYLFAGDTLFNGSVGRTDFPGSSWDALVESVHTRLFDLPEDTVVLPGHGPETSIGHEKAHNPFVGLKGKLWVPGSE